eukprot:3800708-Pyramimonas_sp.AAC.1
MGCVTQTRARQVAPAAVMSSTSGCAPAPKTDWPTAKPPPQALRSRLGHEDRGRCCKYEPWLPRS